MKLDEPELFNDNAVKTVEINLIMRLRWQENSLDCTKTIEWFMPNT